MPYYPFATEIGARYELAGPDGTIAVFNDPAVANYVGMLTEVTGLDSPEIREVAQDNVEADGGTHGAFYLGRRPITLNGRVFGHASIAERNLRLDIGRRASLGLRGDSTLTWKPSARSENFIWNPRATVDAGNNTALSSGWTLTRMATGAPGGWTTGFQVTGSTATTASATPYMGANTSASTGGGLGGFPVSPGDTLNAAVSAKVSAVSSGAVSNLSFRVYWWKADGSASSTSFSSVATQAPVTGTTYTMSGSVTAPSDAYFGSARIVNTQTNPTNSTLQYSGVMVSGGSNTTYIDGDQANMYWFGTPYASPSGDFIELMIPCRRQQPWRETGAWVKEFQCQMVAEMAVIQGRYLNTVNGSPASVENRGNYITYPVTTITGTAVNPSVSSSLGGSLSTTGLTLASGEAITIDGLRHTAVFTAGARNGQNANQYLNYSSSSWLAVPGMTTMTATASAGTLSISWRDAWA